MDYVQRRAFHSALLSRGEVVINPIREGQYTRINQWRLGVIGRIVGCNQSNAAGLQSFAEGCLEENLDGLFNSNPGIAPHVADPEFDDISGRLKRDWPAFIAYHREEERNAQ